MSAPEYCTTRQAANLLGISVTYVQHLVEAGTLEAWKTRGGHRRIPLMAVQAYHNLMKGGVAKPQRAANIVTTVAAAEAVGLTDVSAGPIGELSLMIIEDSPMQSVLYSRQLAAWKLPIAVTYCESGYQALIQITRRRPDILLADIVMEGIDGYEVITTILGHPELQDMHIAIVSSMAPDQLAARGGVPAGVVHFQKPLNNDELRGYLRACCAAQLRVQTLRAGAALRRQSTLGEKA